MSQGGTARLAPLLAAAAIGWLLVVTSDGGKEWTVRTVLLAFLVGAIGTAITWAWHPLSSALDPMRASGVPTVLDLGFAMVPALAATVVVGRPGAATLGHVTRLALAVATGLPGASTYPALALLQVPLAMLPVELYSSAAKWARRPELAHRTPLGGSVIGLLLGLGSVIATFLVIPGLMAPGEIAAETAVTLAVGAVVGWLMVAGMQRAGLFDRSFVPLLSTVETDVYRRGEQRGDDRIAAGRDDQHGDNRTDDGPVIVRRIGRR